MSSYSSFHPPARILMGPGPSNVPARILTALARPTVGHLDPEFVRLMEELKDLLRYAFRTSNEFSMPVSGPGTAGMEACVVNLVEPGDKVIVCENGVFGRRLKEMVTRSGGVVAGVDDAWGRAVDPEKVDRAIREHPDAVLVAFVHAETSTGARSDADGIARLARDAGMLTVVDAVTSLAGIPLEVDRWGLDAVYAGTQKCLSVPPGLSPVTLSERAVARVRNRRTRVRSWFMDFNLVLGYWGEEAQRVYHHTAPVNALYGLHEGLSMLREEGLEASWERHRRNHLALAAGLEALGLRLAVPEAERLPQLNAVMIPEGVDDRLVRRRLLEDFGIEIGAGLGSLAGRIWRIGLMGYGSRRENVEICIRALGSILLDEAGGSGGVDLDAALAAVEASD
jgi:alanine-glyoxylate transaminase / serine-glyoxylate transaminase / serine-pyruvate transaminase